MIKCPRCGSKHLMVDRSGGNGNWLARCNDCRKKFPYPQPYFNGELMTCAICGTQKQHVVGEETDWRVIELDERHYYICTAHLPPDGASKEAFRDAYTAILSNITNRND
jgi:hypothetical protein